MSENNETTFKRPEGGYGWIIVAACITLNVTINQSITSLKNSLIFFLGNTFTPGTMFWNHIQRCIRGVSHK